MAIVYIDDDATTIEKHELELDDPMPYVDDGTLKVGEFRGHSCSTVMWTTRDAMESWNTTRENYGSGIPVGYAFRRIWEGGHAKQSQHYAGTSFDVAQALSPTQRNQLRRVANDAGVWSYLEPAYLTPTWLHFDKRYGRPACSAGFPVLRKGMRGVYVFVLQDALNALGYPTGGLDGVFGEITETAVWNFQGAKYLNMDGVAGCQTWQLLTGHAMGIGQTDTVVEKCY